MKKKEIMAALKSRIQPVENSEAGELHGGFAEFANKIQDAGSGNGLCSNNDLCNNNSTCSNNSVCSNHGTCIGKPTDSSEKTEIMNFGTIF
ncbi:MAG: hypothetical protein K2I28_07815 [Muribaculaceae bacterium]|nr:hypothetical protein [Muribaculaceae bacterium]